MTLAIQRIELRSFRSYEAFELDPSETLTIAVGPNATGKTNIVEAVQLVTAGESFRHPKWAECIRWGDHEARIGMEARSADGRALEVELEIRETGRRAYTINGKPARRQHEVSGVLPCVVFTPEDLAIVKESAEKRRTAVDGVGVQLSASYAALKGEYDRIVRQRNAVLKSQERDPGLLGAWSDKLASVGAALVEHRIRLFKRLAPRVSEAYANLASGETLQVTYSRPWARETADETRDSMEEEIRESLERFRREEMARGMTVVGPHRDDLVFNIDGRDARRYASQGQQRSIALAWKLGEVGVIEEVSGQPPVLLLDDVMSELDETRRHSLTRLVGDAAQTLITTTNLGYFDDSLVERATIVRLQ